jgi:hypothetical protein
VAHAPVEQVLGARQQPVALAAGQVALRLELQQQLGPFGEVAGLVAPGAEQVGLVVQVVVPVDGCQSRV